MQGVSIESCISRLVAATKNSTKNNKFGGGKGKRKPQTGILQGWCTRKYLILGFSHFLSKFARIWINLWIQKSFKCHFIQDSSVGALLHAAANEPTANAKSCLENFVVERSRMMMIRSPPTPHSPQSGNNKTNVRGREAPRATKFRPSYRQGRDSTA